MNTKMIRDRESELIEMTFREQSGIDGLHILSKNIKERLGAFSFYVDDIHQKLVTKLLNDKFGIQIRGGCSCAGTYCHFLLNADFVMSKEITDKIDAGDLSMKPGWVKLSIHPTMNNDELFFILDAIRQTVENAERWKKDYCYDRHTNEFQHCNFHENNSTDLTHWFTLT
jgi:selenocysteine lyase/cysteine desulfurase